MTIEELMRILPWLRDGEEITITLRKDALIEGFLMAAGGPEVLSTAQAKRLLGYSAERWADWARAGRIRDAYRDEQNRWRLPNRSCRVLLDEQMAAGKRIPRVVGRAKGKSTKPVFAKMTLARTGSKGPARPASQPAASTSALPAIPFEFGRGPRSRQR
jgi:hypothetical protein